MNNADLVKKLDVIAGLISAGVHKRTVIKLDQSGRKIERETTAEMPTPEHAKEYCSEAYGLIRKLIDDLQPNAGD